MWKKIERYYRTLKYLKRSQWVYLVKNRLDGRHRAATLAAAPAHRDLKIWMEGLDEDCAYLERFCLDGLLSGEVLLLHESGRPEGKGWSNPQRTHLWNFNLHYMEFLIPLAAAYKRTRENVYYDCFRKYCRSWIRDNQDGTGDGWHPYTISLRLTNWWICLDGFGKIVEDDRAFMKQLNDSMYAQYRHLQKRLERHLLGNHYFENLKAVLLGTLYFNEPEIYDRYRAMLLKEIKEQVLPDGMHYERSPMYHKIILEDMMRTAKGVQVADFRLYQELLTMIWPMADAMYSLEDRMGRTPLFNDSGDNVARPMGSILEALRREFAICPQIRREFPDAGYYLLQTDAVKMILDAGEIAPDYMPGHGHCDGLSFELSYKGKPLFVNSGTGQYQGPYRNYFRSTAAHNTVVIDKEEQSECWGEHRVAGRIRKVSGGCGKNAVFGRLATCHGKRHNRKLVWEKDALQIQDTVNGSAQAYFHLAPGYQYILQKNQALVQTEDGRAVCEIKGMPKDRMILHERDQLCHYAPEFGIMLQNQTLEIQWDGTGKIHAVQIVFGRLQEENI